MNKIKLALLLALALFSASAFAAERQVINPDQDGNLVLRVNDGGTVTDVMTTVGSSALTGIMTSSPLARFDVSDGAIGLVVGADNNATTRTNSTQKFFRVGAPHYLTAEEPMTLLSGQSDGTNNFLFVGGGTSQLNSSTEIRFYTGATTSTLTGTLNGFIASTGAWTIGASGGTAVHTVNGGLSSTGEIVANIGFSAGPGNGNWYSFTTSSTADDAGATFTLPNDSVLKLIIIGTGATLGSNGFTENLIAFCRAGAYFTRFGSMLREDNTTAITSDWDTSIADDCTLAGSTDGRLRICCTDDSTIKVFNREGGPRSFTAHVFAR